MQRSHCLFYCSLPFHIADNLYFFQRELSGVVESSSMTEESCIRTIITALQSYEGVLLSTKISTREVDGSFTFYAPGVIGVDFSVWDKHGEKR